VIAQVTGTLVSKDLDHVEVMTAGGVAYELAWSGEGAPLRWTIRDGVTLTRPKK
jgi:YD repeat-containing protein